MDIIAITEHFYNQIYVTAKFLVNKCLDLRFLENGLLQEFSIKNKIEYELFDPEDDYNCPVCYDEKKKDETYFKFDCGHILCGNCFSSLIINSHDRCPMCRKEIELEKCKINKTIDESTFLIPEDEIDDMACEYVYEYITWTSIQTENIILNNYNNQIQ